MFTRAILAAGATCALLAAPSRGDEAQDGFHLSQLPYPGSALTATLSTGDVVSFDGLSVERYDEFGLHLATLASFPTSRWGSFLMLDPSESFVVLGESSMGELYAVDLTVGGALYVATLDFNYDAVFEDATHLLVSAATCGLGCDNEIHRVDLLTGATTLLATVPGPSGPLALGPGGEVYYGTVPDAYPPPPGASSILAWDVELLTGNPVLSEADAAVLGTGYETLGSLVVDPHHGSLYVAENDGATGTNRVLRAASDANLATVLVEGAPWNWITNLEFQAGDGVAAFLPYQPSRGGRLLYSTSDYVSLFERYECMPLRPSSLLSGPGTSGAGNVDLTILAGPPGGIAWALHCPSSLFNSAEVPIFLAARQINLFVGLDPWTTELHGVPVLLDGTGTGTVTFYNGGSLTGALAIQALVFDAPGQPVATSWPAFL